MKKMHKMLLGLVLVFAMVLSLGVSTVNAGTDTKAYEYNGVTYYYTVSGTSCTIIGADNAKGTIELPRTIETYIVTVVGKEAFKDNVNITSAIIPENVTTIEPSAFVGCAALKNVVLPNTLRTISNKAFANTAISKVYIPSTVTTVDASAFSGTSVDGLYTRPVATTPTPTVKPNPTATPKPTVKPTPSGNTDVDVTVVTVSGMNKPEKITKGSSFGLKGTVKVESDVNTITAYILNTDEVAVIKVTDTITKGSYNINKGKINKDLVFGKLGIGKYTYLVTVSGKNVAEQEIMRAEFEVVKATAKPTSTPKPTATPTPTPAAPIVEAKTISVTVPLNIAVNADPASEYVILTSEASISALRDSCDVSVTVYNSYCDDSSKVLVSDEDQLPSGKTWDDLSERYAKRYFSIGLSPQRGWDDVYSRDAVMLGSNPTGLGDLGAGSTGSIFIQKECGSNLREVVDFNINLGILIKSVRE